MKVQGEFAYIVFDSNPEHRLNVRIYNVKKVLRVQYLKAVCGMVERALFWYELYTTTLKDVVFNIIPEYKCVANNMTNGSQCTVGWFVDDNNI